MGSSTRRWWLISVVVSAALAGQLFHLLAAMNHYQIDPFQLVTKEDVTKYLDEYRKRSGSSPVELETGIFIQSLEFYDSADVKLSGYIWQRFEDGVHDALKPAKGDRPGFVLPEQVDADESAPREAYRRREGDVETIGWYFEATLRQPFDYRYYPFDHKTVWVRLWPAAFDRNVVLVPALDSYASTKRDAIFGIEHDIVLGAWTWNNTYFDFKEASYDTNFGITDYVGQKNFPELHYNFVIERKFEDAFITHLLPLFLVAVLLFGVLLTVSSNENLAERHGFSTSGVIGTCSALLFVVLLAHIQLKNQFQGAGIVYMEYFYLLMYAVLILSSANAYLFTVANHSWLRPLQSRDNLLFKVAYWPLLLGSMVVITAIVHATRS